MEDTPEVTHTREEVVEELGEEAVEKIETEAVDAESPVGQEVSEQ